MYYTYNASSHTPRDVGVKAIESLMEKKGKFDYILLETTGLADPGPIASIFWLDEGLGSEIYLDGEWVRVWWLWGYVKKYFIININCACLHVHWLQILFNSVLT